MPEPGQREEEVMSEAMERSIEANMKILVGNEIAHSNRVNNIMEANLANLVENANNAAKAQLERLETMANAYMNHCDDMNKQIVENNRFTLDRLYGVFPEEATGIATMLKALEAAGIITINPTNKS